MEENAEGKGRVRSRDGRGRPRAEPQRGAQLPHDSSRRAAPEPWPMCRLTPCASSRGFRARPSTSALDLQGVHLPNFGHGAVADWAAARAT